MAFRITSECPDCEQSGDMFSNSSGDHWCESCGWTDEEES